MISLHPFHWIPCGIIDGLCVLKGFSMFLHNIYKRILLHPVPLTGFIVAVCIDCVSKEVEDVFQNIYKIGLHSKLTQTGTIILELLLPKRIIKLWH